MADASQKSVLREFLIERTGYAFGCFAMLCLCIVLTMAFYAASVPTPPSPPRLPAPEKSPAQMTQDCIDNGLSKFQLNMMRGDDHTAIVKDCVMALGRQP